MFDNRAVTPISPPCDLAVLIPASNEERLIAPCLDAVLAADPVPTASRVVVTVIANGCHDRTAAVARERISAFAARGWLLQVIDLPQGGKTRAMATGEIATPAAVTVYLDADVTISPALLAETHAVLSAHHGPAYASGRVNITAKTPISRLYARFWRKVPFMRNAVPGCGYFAMNAAGRARFGDWPHIISDDTFARLQFAPTERIGLAASYDWPIAEGWDALVRVRRRQDRGVRQCETLFPALMRNNDPAPTRGDKLRLILCNPLSFAVYGGVALAVKARKPSDEWVRGR